MAKVIEVEGIEATAVLATTAIHLIENLTVNEMTMVLREVDSTTLGGIILRAVVVVAFQVMASIDDMPIRAEEAHMRKKIGHIEIKGDGITLVLV